MGGGGKVNKTLEQDRAKESARSDQLFAKLMQPTPYEQRFEQQSGDWDKFLAGKDYSQPPGFLNYNLAGPAQIQKQTERMADLQGVGAAGLGGDNSIALQLAKQRGAAESAQNAGAAYEQALGDENAYFRGASPGYANMSNQKYGSLYGQSSSNYANSMDAWVKNVAAGKQMWGSIIGGGLMGAGTFFAPWAKKKWGDTGGTGN